MLILGGRYGNCTGSGLSVTNLEFLEAVAKSIPIYVFIKKDILTLMPFWKNNPGNDYSSVVDNTAVFRFIEEVRSKRGHWTFPFELARDICSTLRMQLSFLMSDCLALRAKLYPGDPLLNSLSGDVLRTYLEKPDGWEYIALAKCMREAVHKHSSLRFDLTIGISFGPTIELNCRADLVRWIQSKLADLGVLVHGLNSLFNCGVTPAIGLHGAPGDMTRIVHFADRFGQAYLSILNWTLEFRRISTPQEFIELTSETAKLPATALQEMEDYGTQLENRWRDAMKSATRGATINLELTLTLPDLRQFSEAMAKFGGPSVV